MRKSLVLFIVAVLAALAAHPVGGQNDGPKLDPKDTSSFQVPATAAPPSMPVRPGSFTPQDQDVPVPAILGGTMPPANVLPKQAAADVPEKATESQPAATAPPWAAATTKTPPALAESNLPRQVPDTSTTKIPAVDALQPSLQNNMQPAVPTTWQDNQPLRQDSNLIVTPASLRGHSGLPNGRPELAISAEGPQLRVDTIGPKKIGIGKPAAYEFVVVNTGNKQADQVIVGIDIPDWIEVTHVEHSTGNREITDGNGDSKIVWNIPAVNVDQTEKLIVEIIPQDAKPFEVAVDWTFRPIHGRTTIEVTEPQLAIQIAGPDEVQYGETALYHVTVSNPGTGVAENVNVALPEVLGGEQARLGNVGPGEQKQFQVELIARSAGVLELMTTVAADGGLTKSDARNIMVRRAQLDVQLTGAKMKFAGSTSTYTMTVANTGDAIAKDVVAAVALPAGVRYVSGIDTAEMIDGGIRWNVGMLSPGNQREYELECIMDTAGDIRIEAASRGAGDLAAMTDITTRVDAIADLVLSVTDPKGPLPIGEDIIYEIHIRNRGTKSARDVQVVMQFSEGVEPTTAEGLTHELLSGQVLFTPISQIDPNQELVLKVHAKSDTSGTHRFRAQLVCEESDAHEVAEGTTRFFGDEVTNTSRSENTDGQSRFNQ